MKIKRFNRDIYSDRSLKTTVAAFKSIADIRIFFISGYAEVTFFKCKYGVSQTIFEFENYLIAVENA